MQHYLLTLQSNAIFTDTVHFLSANVLSYPLGNHKGDASFYPLYMVWIHMGSQSVHLLGLSVSPPHSALHVDIRPIPCFQKNPCHLLLGFSLHPFYLPSLSAKSNFWMVFLSLLTISTVLKCSMDRIQNCTKGQTVPPT